MTPTAQLGWNPGTDFSSGRDQVGNGPLRILSAQTEFSLDIDPDTAGKGWTTVSLGSDALQWHRVDQGWTSDKVRWDPSKHLTVTTGPLRNDGAGGLDLGAPMTASSSCQDTLRYPDAEGEHGNSDEYVAIDSRVWVDRDADCFLSTTFLDNENPGCDPFLYPCHWSEFEDPTNDDDSTDTGDNQRPRYDTKLQRLYDGYFIGANDPDCQYEYDSSGPHENDVTCWNKDLYGDSTTDVTYFQGAVDGYWFGKTSVSWPTKEGTDYHMNICLLGANSGDNCNPSMDITG